MPHGRMVFTAVIALVALALGGCAAKRAVQTTVGVSVFATRTAVKGTVGAGKLAARGAGALVGANPDDE